LARLGAVCVGFDELPDGEAVRGLIGGDRNILAHEWSPGSIGSDTAAAVIPGWLAVRETPRSRIGHIAIAMLVLENIDAVLRRRPAPFLVTSHEYHQARQAHNDSHRHSNVSLLEKACGMQGRKNVVESFKAFDSSRAADHLFSPQLHMKAVAPDGHEASHSLRT
jgi:hypothetical protein